MTDRHRPAKDMLRMIQLLSAHKAFGLSVEEIAIRMETTRRTAQRYLAALHDIEPDLRFHIAGDSQKKFWYLPSPRTRIPAASAEQLSSLTEIAAFMRAQGHENYAHVLEELRETLQAGLDRAALIRLDPDLEALDASIEATHHPGPRACFDPAIRRFLLDAIIRQRQVGFVYTDVRGLGSTAKRVSPLAIVLGPRAYLVGRDEESDSIRNYALTGIAQLEVREDAARRDGFDAREYVNRSFGAFHDEQFQQWVLRFSADAAYDLACYQFHPAQTMTRLSSGEIEVSFFCESIREVAYECFRWSERLTWFGPAPLRDAVLGICSDMQRVAAAGSHAGSFRATPKI